MKRLILIALVLTASFVNAQITITSTNMPSSGDTIRYSDGRMSTLGDYTVTGANYTWNFDTLRANKQGVRNFESAASTGYFFFGSGYGEKIADSIGFGAFTFKNLYNFYKKNSSVFYIDGLGMTYQSFPIPNFYSKKDSMYQFPLTYPNRDSSHFRFSTITTTAIPVTYIKEGYRLTEVDGWGTISTEYATSVNVPCIRVVTTQYSIDTVKTSLLPSPFNAFGFPNYQRSYQWLVLGEKIPYLEVNGTVVAGNFVPNQVRYRDIPRSFVGINEAQEKQLAFAIYPNPAVTELNILVPKDKELGLEIYNVSGQLIIKKTLLNKDVLNKHDIDISALSQGMYTGKLSDGSSVQNFKFIKQ